MLVKVCPESEEDSDKFAFAIPQAIIYASPNSWAVVDN